MEELKSRCRICSKKEGNEKFKDIFEGESSMDLHIIINKLLPINVVQWDRLPHLICDSCIEKLHAVNTFYEDTRNVDIYLKSLLSFLSKHKPGEPKNQDVNHLCCHCKKSQNKDHENNNFTPESRLEDFIEIEKGECVVNLIPGEHNQVVPKPEIIDLTDAEESTPIRKEEISDKVEKSVPPLKIRVLCSEKNIVRNFSKKTPRKSLQSFWSEDESENNLSKKRKKNKKKEKSSFHADSGISAKGQKKKLENNEVNDNLSAIGEILNNIKISNGNNDPSSSSTEPTVARSLKVNKRHGRGMMYNELVDQQILEHGLRGYEGARKFLLKYYPEELVPEIIGGKTQEDKRNANFKKTDALRKKIDTVLSRK